MTTHFVMMGVCGCGKTTAALSLQNTSTNVPTPKATISTPKPTATKWARASR